MSNIRSHVSRVLMDRLDWNLLRTYLTIMQERSISRAAARLTLRSCMMTRKVRNRFQSRRSFRKRTAAARMARGLRRIDIDINISYAVNNKSKFD